MKRLTRKRGQPALYVTLRDRWLSEIIEGRYKNGDHLPTERQLARIYKVSRITVRKALDLMEKEQILRRVQGRGTQVIYRKDGFSGSTDTIALIGSINTPFFQSFLKSFEQAAEKKGSLVLFKEDRSRNFLTGKNLISRLLKQGIRNLVVWPHHKKLDLDALMHARGMGCNLVFFDQAVHTLVGDALALDNRNAIARIIKVMKGQKRKTINFVNWTGLRISTTTDREQAFHQVEGGKVHRISWRLPLEKQIPTLVREIKKTRPDGVVCVNGSIAVLLVKTFGKQGPAVGCIDYTPDMKGLGIVCVAQPMQAFGKEAYNLLAAQNLLGPRWKPSVVRLKGKLFPST